MIETEQSVLINAGIDEVWDYVQDIRHWSNLFPGSQSCEILDEHASRWNIKVGAGGMVKVVDVLVSVEQWNGPEQVAFSYRLNTEPVEGNGSYTARRIGPGDTEISLKLQVIGSGQMAPMWEAMCRPLLPQMAKSFAGRLKSEIEGPAIERPSVIARILAWLRNLLRRL